MEIEVENLVEPVVDVDTFDPTLFVDTDTADREDLVRSVIALNRKVEILGKAHAALAKGLSGVGIGVRYSRKVSVSVGGSSIAYENEAFVHDVEKAAAWIEAAQAEAVSPRNPKGEQ
jgi:hypothetical protein